TEPPLHPACSLELVEALATEQIGFQVVAPSGFVNPVHAVDQRVDRRHPLGANAPASAGGSNDDREGKGHGESSHSWRSPESVLAVITAPTVVTLSVAPIRRLEANGRHAGDSSPRWVERPIGISCDLDTTGEFARGIGGCGLPPPGEPILPSLRLIGSGRE